MSSDAALLSELLADSSDEGSDGGVGIDGLNIDNILEEDEEELGGVGRRGVPIAVTSFGRVSSLPPFAPPATQHDEEEPTIDSLLQAEASESSSSDSDDGVQVAALQELLVHAYTPTVFYQLKFIANLMSWPPGRPPSALHPRCSVAS